MIVEREKLPGLLKEAEILLRPELLEILMKGENIIRFTGDDLPEGVVVDNVKDHTLRCFAIARSLNLGGDKKEKLEKIVLLHDLAEIENLTRLGRKADMTAPEKKENPKLAEEVNRKEAEVAREIFNDEEYALYQEFEDGGSYLKNPDRDTFSEIGALAKLIDTVDPDLILHGALSRWAMTKDYNPQLLKSGMSLSYAFLHGTILAGRFSRTRDWEIFEAGILMMNEHFIRISLMWNQVFDSGGQIPEEIEEYV